MPRPSLEIYVRNLAEPDAVDWLRTVLTDVTSVRTEPLAVYDGTYNGTPVTVQIAEQVEGGAYTHLWFRSEALPWDDVAACARAAYAATGCTVLCYPEGEEAPWTMLRVDEAGDQRVDAREEGMHG